ncbi:carboxypeptidase-like regulatory domain-containing protein [Bacteroides cutis]|jgi:hypothetical protein|uniref:carboxypeptidase-like regulatory domain-containing protein n=1 Tax=Bacteroides cutis TaxID=2024197 RepID=UPI0015E096DC|nr:carboxypeptidase-like regulatory domain-containing protein [Bacteroides cutis]
MKKLVEFTLGCLLILLYVGATLLYAQNSALNNFIITGVVKDKDNRKKLDNVNVSVVGTNIGTMTNADGIFSLKVTETGMFDRYVSNIRFKDETLEDVLRVINKESSF